MLLTLAGFLYSGYLRAVEPKSADAPPKGDLTHFTFDHSQIFPGTVRDYWIYVPKPYDPARPACLYVNQLLYVTTRMGIQVCDQTGRVNCIIPTPNGRIANLCFGGPNFDILYATCGDRVYRRKVKTQGANAYQAPIKPPTPRL